MSTQANDRISQDSIKALKADIAQCMLRDQFRLRRSLRQFSANDESSESKQFEKFEALTQRVEKSKTLATLREQMAYTLTWNEDLPVTQKREDIAKAIQDNQIVIVAGETGSGKTTQLPKICLELGLGVKGFIGHTQPRRLAARSISERISEELKTPLGTTVGFHMRFNDNYSDQTRIKVMTDGILLAEITNDRFLEKYDTLIIDEAHERSLNIDFILGYLKRIALKRPDLKIIITSATLDHERFAEYFKVTDKLVPVIEVSGRGFPVDIYHQDDDDDNRPIAEKIYECLEHIEAKERQAGAVAGDALIFLATERDIREASHYIKKQYEYAKDMGTAEVLPLYARLGVKDQKKIFQPSSARGRRIVLATNVAETSLTVPNIRYVIDTGLARLSRYSYKSKVQRLPIEKISQASANQRTGRCGRVMAGECYRLYSEDDFDNRETFTPPEIQRTNLASVILQMAALGLGDIQQFPFIEAPDHRFVRDGYQLLFELNALNEHHKLTSVGKRIAHFPIEPRFARILIEAEKLNCLKAIRIIVAGLSIQDPRERPYDKQQQADAKHQLFIEKTSDFITLLNLWKAFEKERQELSQNQLRKWCTKHYLSYQRMREWRDTHLQLCQLHKSRNKQVNKKKTQSVDNADILHKAMLSGLLTQVFTSTQASGQENANPQEQARKKLAKFEFLGVRNRKVMLWPGSVLFKSRPAWGVSAQLLETENVYAHMSAPIQVEWLGSLAKHLLKYSYTDEQWSKGGIFTQGAKQKGKVKANEQASLLGLVVYANKRVDYGLINPNAARPVFIEQGLEAFQLPNYPFLKHNRKVINALNQQEAKLRRLGEILPLGYVQDFYSTQLPQNIYDQQSLDDWLAQDESHDQLLRLDKAQILADAGILPSDQMFPEQLRINDDLSLKLTYHFDPKKHYDGVTLHVPVVVVNQISQRQLDWLVPGFLEDKCTHLIKSLPKSYRKQFVPAKNYARALMQALEFGSGNLLENITRELKRMTGKSVPIDAFDMDALPTYIQMNIRVADPKGKVLMQSHSLADVLTQFESGASEYLKQSVDEQKQKHYKAASQEKKHELDIIGRKADYWAFGDLPVSYQQKHSGIAVNSFIALEDKQHAVVVSLFDQREKAEWVMQQGLRRLFYLSMQKSLKGLQKQIPQFNTLVLHYRHWGDAKQLFEQLALLACEQCFLKEGIIYKEKDFQSALNQRGQLFDAIKSLAAALLEALISLKEMRQAIAKAPDLLADTVEDIEWQIDDLFYEGFLDDVPAQQLLHYPRYLNAITFRWQRLNGKLKQDQQFIIEFDGYMAELEDAREEHQRPYTLLQEPLFWMLQEYRVNCFAQHLKTAIPVSKKKIQKALEAL